MRVTGSFDTLKQVWPANVSHDAPKLYIANPQGNVVSVFPIAGQNYEWQIEPPVPEGIFLSQYGYAHKVDSVQP